VPKLPQRVEDSLMLEILQLFMHLNSPKVREALGNGVKALGLMDATILQIMADMNKLKRGLADMELDIDCAITAIKTLMGREDYSMMELSSIIYCVVYLMQHEEYSMREYAHHGLNHVLKCLVGKDSAKIVE
jgi:hypothetical protein